MGEISHLGTPAFTGAVGAEVISRGYHPNEPGSPLNGPVIQLLTHPP